LALSNIAAPAVSLGHDENLIVFLGKKDESQYLYIEESRNSFSGPRWVSKGQKTSLAI